MPLALWQLRDARQCTPAGGKKLKQEAENEKKKKKKKRKENKREGPKVDAGPSKGPAMLHSQTPFPRRVGRGE